MGFVPDDQVKGLDSAIARVSGDDVHLIESGHPFRQDQTW
jgi:hypothetical protein